jgi:hypothetical protein
MTTKGKPRNKFKRQNPKKSIGVTGVEVVDTEFLKHSPFKYMHRIERPYAVSEGNIALVSIWSFN